MDYLNTTYITNTSITSEVKMAPKKADETLTLAFNIIRIIVLLIGSIGNVLILITMTRGSLKKLTTCFYLTIVAAAGR